MLHKPSLGSCIWTSSVQPFWRCWIKTDRQTSQDKFILHNLELNLELIEIKCFNICERKLMFHLNWQNFVNEDWFGWLPFSLIFLNTCAPGPHPTSPFEHGILYICPLSPFFMYLCSPYLWNVYRPPPHPPPFFLLCTWK